jgi:amino acid transporter
LGRSTHKISTMSASFLGEAAVKEKDARDDGTPVESINDTGDIEGRIISGFEENGQFIQGLHQRHIQMIALAGTLGTGLFLSIGQAIARSGPLGTWLAYSIIGATLFSVVLAVGEMGALVPLNGGIVRYSEKFVDPALAFANGWNEIYAHIVGIPGEITAAAVLVEFWIQINNGIWITVFGVVMLCSALVFVRVYGELEFTFALMKIALVIGLNIMVGLQVEHMRLWLLTLS